MRKASRPHTDPDDLFSDTRMSFGEHIEDLRVHLIRAMIGFVLGMAISLAFLGKPVLNYIAAPVEHELFEYWKRTGAQREHDIREKFAELPVVRFQYEIYAPQLFEALEKRYHLKSGGEAAAVPTTEPLVATARRFLHDLQADQLLDKEVAGDQWVKVDVRMQDPRDWLVAMNRMKPYFDPPLLRTLTVTEAFMVYFKVSLFTGLIVSSPWVFYQVWAFVAAGLYPNEKRLVHVYMPFSLFLFATGVLVCQFMVMPKAIEALLWFNEWLNFQPDLRLSDWLGFAIVMPVVFGISFQTPLVMTFLNKIGIVSVEVFQRHRRMAWFLLAVFAAVITPTVDPISMTLLWIPLGFLYELGIKLCAWQSRPAEEMEAEKSEELVEV